MEGFIIFFVNLDKSNKEDFLYQQLYKEIKRAILNQELKEGEKLPSKRTFADQLNVSVNTITNAYEQLLVEGYIYAIERSGYFVEKITQLSEQHNDPSHDLPKKLKEKKENEQSGWLSLSHIGTDIELFSFKEWFKCQQLAIDNHSSEFEYISHQQGPYTVRETIANMIKMTRSVECEPEQIVLSVGTQALMSQLLGLLQREHNRPVDIAVENPGYVRLYHLMKQKGANVIPIEVDEDGIDTEAVDQSDPDLVFVTPSHQFPTGAIMSISRRIELLNWIVQKPDRYIIEDDYDSEFKYQTDNIPSLQSLDGEQRVIYMGSFSKSLLMGFRISYMVLPFPILEKYREHYKHLLPLNDMLSLFTLHEFIQKGSYMQHVRRMNQHYEKQRQTLVDALEKKFGDDLSIHDVPAGLHFIATFKTHKSYEQIEADLTRYKLDANTIRRFYIQNEPTNNGSVSLVIGFAALKKRSINQAVDRLYHVIYT